MLGEGCGRGQYNRHTEVNTVIATSFCVSTGEVEKNSSATDEAARTQKNPQEVLLNTWQPQQSVHANVGADSHMHATVIGLQLQQWSN